MSAADIAANNRGFEKAVERERGSHRRLARARHHAIPPDGPIVAGREAVKQLWESAIREHGMTKFRITPKNLMSSATWQAKSAARR